jgi:Protein of unknown function (DUF4239)
LSILKISSGLYSKGRHCSESGRALRLSVPTPMLVILVFWLTVIFIGFGLFAPRNRTVIASLFFAGLAASGAIFLIMEMYTPFRGVMHVSSEPVRFALAHLSQ